jgi:hypothetical protein
MRTLASRTGPTGVLISVGAAVAAAAGVAASARARERVRSLEPPAKAAVGTLLELRAHYVEAERSFNTLTVPLPWDEDDLTIAVADQRRAARDSVLHVSPVGMASIPVDPIRRGLGVGSEDVLDA